MGDDSLNNNVKVVMAEDSANALVMAIANRK